MLLVSEMDGRKVTKYVCCCVGVMNDVTATVSASAAHSAMSCQLSSCLSVISG